MRQSGFWRSWRQMVFVMAFPMVLAGCGSFSKSTLPSADQPAPAVRATPKGIPALPPAGSGRGGYYLDDGPADSIPDGLHDVPDAEPRIDPYSRAANRPYSVFGKTYTPITDNRPYKKRGYGSWYGKKFHGRKTSSGETYDMFKMTAAHPTLPIPCYVRVTHLKNGKQVIVRVNDRGPFKSGRIIDLSYTAALRLGYLGKGSGELEVEHLLPEEIRRLAQDKRREPAAAAALQSGGSQEDKAQEAQDGDFLDRFLASMKSQEKPDASGTMSAYYLQLGVYRQAVSANSMQAKYSREWQSEISSFEVIPSGIHYKLFAGPFETREKAADAARRFSESARVTPLIVQR